MGRKSLDKKRVNDPKTRAKWIEQLLPIYMKNGLKKFTMTTISEKLGVSKATIYKHFASREEILEEVVQFKIREISAFEAVIANKDVPYLMRYNEAIRMASVQLAGISNQFLLDLWKFHPELWQRIQSLHFFAGERATVFYQEGIDLGILCDDFDPAWLTTIDKICLVTLSDPNFLVEHNLTPQQTVANYFLMKSKGILKNKENNE